MALRMKEGKDEGVWQLNGKASDSLRIYGIDCDSISIDDIIRD